MRALVVLGIDPGLARTGYGIIRQEGERLLPLAYGCLETTAPLSPERRLLQLHQALAVLLQQYWPDYLALEALLFNRNARSALQVGQARGVVLLAAAQAGVAVREFNPLTVKQAVTGSGGAAKQQVQRMVQTLLALPKPPRPDDTADALAVAVCCLHHLTFEKAVGAHDRPSARHPLE